MVDDPLADNPFFVLELPITATAMDVERRGKMLLAKLELGLDAATRYASPSGTRQRTADDVRRAMQALADPLRRLAIEPFASARCVYSEHAHAAVDVDNGEDISSLLWWRA